MLGLAPDLPTVGRYIQGLKPVTLIQDTRVTNHTYESGAAVPFQAILQAGTAVLVNDKGVPVARCRCGNPLLEPIFYPRVRQQVPAALHAAPAVRAVQRVLPALPAAADRHSGPLPARGDPDAHHRAGDGAAARADAGAGSRADARPRPRARPGAPA